jgi:adenosylhomocysteine nucleosidase
MEIEVAALIDALGNNQTDVQSGISFVRGQLHGADVVVAQCGMGKVNAAICAQAMLHMYSPHIIINIGVAGALSPQVVLGDTVIGSAMVQHDYDISPIGFPKGFVHEVGDVHFPCCGQATEELEAIARRLGHRCHTGIIATGDQFIESAETKADIYNSFNALACEMEGASIAHVCALANVRCAVIRAISDSAGDGSANECEEFARLAAARSVALLSEYVKNYKPFIKPAAQ